MNYQSGIPSDGFVTRKWVKQYFSISNSTLHLWIKNKRLNPPVLVGPRAVRFRVEDIQAFEAKLLANLKEG